MGEGEGQKTVCHHQTQVECSWRHPPTPVSAALRWTLERGEKALALHALLAFHGLAAWHRCLMGFASSPRVLTVSPF